jgi:phosphodiesterase/alkaline phosphatase D-like protein
MMLITTFLLLCITLSHQYYVAPNTTIEAKKSDHKIRMGFGSCYDGLQEGAKGEGNIMHTISRDDKLDLWMWLGDMAYVDKKVLKRKATIWEYALHFSMI